MRHETPSDLDPLFDREVISPEDYKAFWIAYWNLDPETETVDELVSRFASPNPEDAEVQATLDSFLSRKTPSAEGQADQNP